MIHGTAKIVTNAGGGKYTITQTFIDSTTSTYKAGTVGLVAVDAWDVNLDAARAVGDVVTFQMQDSFDGKRVPIISGPGAGGGVGSSPMRLEKAYTFNGDVAWTTIDTRNWRGRWIWITMVDSDSDIDEYAADDVEHWDNLALAYAKQSTQPHAWFQVLLYSVGQPGGMTAVQEISRDIFSPGVLDSGDFFLRMKMDGNLEIMVENWTRRFSVRFSIFSTADPPTVESLG